MSYLQQSCLATKSRDFDERQGVARQVRSVTGRVARCDVACRTVARDLVSEQSVALFYATLTRVKSRAQRCATKLQV